MYVDDRTLFCDDVSVEANAKVVACMSLLGIAPRKVSGAWHTEVVTFSVFLEHIENGRHPKITNFKYVFHILVHW